MIIVYSLFGIMIFITLLIIVVVIIKNRELQKKLIPIFLQKNFEACVVLKEVEEKQIETRISTKSMDLVRRGEYKKEYFVAFGNSDRQIGFIVSPEDYSCLTKKQYYRIGYYKGLLISFQQIEVSDESDRDLFGEIYVE